MLLRVLNQWDPTQATVWPDFFVVPAPFSDARSGLLHVLKSLRVQALVTKFPIEAPLHVAILNSVSWLNQDMSFAMCCGRQP